MKVENNIRVGQLVRIKNGWPRQCSNQLYLVVSKRGENNVELLPVTDKKINERKWWPAEGLSVYA